jgi:hypothetical protein
VSFSGDRAERRLRRSSGTNIGFGFGLNSGTDVASGFDRRSSEENVDGLCVGGSIKVKLGFSLSNCDIVLKLLVELGSSLDFSHCKDGIGAIGGRSSLWTLDQKS